MNLIEYIESRRDEHLNELKEFLRIPSVSTKSEHKPDIERAAHWVAEKLRAAGLENVEITPTKMHPLVYGESLHAAGKPTVLFYGHYDVQPAEPLDLWTSPAFEPTVRDGKLFGRGTADDKGQVHIHIKALEALKNQTGKLPLNVKVMIEGEEEVGSVSLWDFVQRNRERLKADALVVSDTSMLAKGVPSITYGLRGLNYYQVEVAGPAQDLHSGVFGGAAPNPITILAEMIAKLHDKNFRVAITTTSHLCLARNAKRSIPCRGKKRNFARRWAPPRSTAKKDLRSSSGCGRVPRSNSMASGAAISAKAQRL
jgi:acetylornithine deacetylase/succinyl-diaminopimelate desuccinylase-like protein